MNVARSVKPAPRLHDYSSSEEEGGQQAHSSTHRPSVATATSAALATAGGAGGGAGAGGAAAGGAAPMALCFMALDDDVSTNAMAALLSLNFLHDVAKIQLQ